MTGAHETFHELLGDAILEAVRNVVRAGRGLVDPPDADTLTEADIQAAFDSVLSDSTNGRIRAWRVMDVPEEWFDDIDDHFDFGRHWSADPAYTIGHHGLEDFQAKIEAWIPLSSIDWPGTLATRLNNVEQEIRVDDDSPVEVITVSRSPGGDSIWETVWSAQLVVAPKS